MPSRRRQRSRRARSQDGGLLDRAWRLASDPRTVGVLLLAAGALLAATPWMNRPTPLVTSWWQRAVHQPDVLAGAASLGAVALVLLVGFLYNRYRLATGPDAGVDSTADGEFEDEREGRSVDESRLPGLSWLGAICMIGGISLVVGFWFASQRNLAPARVKLAVNETIDHYAIPYGGGELDVMLPLRVRLAKLETGNEITAGIQLFEAGAEPPAPSAIAAGEGIEFDGFRLTFVGMQPDFQKLRGVLSSQRPDTIAAAAVEGETFQVALEGAEYKVLEITRNYLGVMGPAVKLQSPKLGEFWVFERASEAEVAPDLGHDIQLDRVETAPAALFTVAPVSPFWPLALGGTLFVLGFAVLIVFPERIVRRAEGKVRIWSFNEAGRVAEETAARLAGETSGEGRP